MRGSATSATIAAERRSDMSRLPKLLQGELDWIVMKALEKDRARRYETVNGFARDLERYLAGDPVEAGPPSTTYRLRKFAGRHRVGLAMAATMAALLVGGVVVSTWMAVRASRAEAQARAVNEFLRNDVLAQASANTQARPDTKPDPDLKVRTALDRAAAGIQGKFPDQPLVEASIRQTIGETYLDLGLYPEAQRQLERALEVRRRLLGDDHLDTLTVAATPGGCLHVCREVRRVGVTLGQSVRSESSSAWRGASVDDSGSWVTWRGTIQPKGSIRRRSHSLQG